MLNLKSMRSKRGDATLAAVLVGAFLVIAMFAVLVNLNPSITGAATITLEGVTITKNDSLDPVSAGQPLDYTITIAADSAITNVIVTEIYPDKFSFVSASPAATLDNNIWTLGDISAGNSTSIIIQGIANATTNETFLNKIKVEWGAGNNTFNTSLMEETIVVALQVNETVANETNETVQNEMVEILTPQLTLTKSDSPDPVNNHSQLDYTITITETGNTTAYNVTLVETYPDSYIFLSASPVPNVDDNVAAGNAETKENLSG